MKAVARIALLLAAGAGVIQLTGAPFVGSEVCAGCHAPQAALHRESHHAQALRKAAESPMAARFLGQTVREKSGIRIEYSEGDSPGSIAARISSGSSGAQSLMATLEWAFGAGAQAFTPVGRYNGEYFEHRLSWYESSKRLSLTAGHPAVPAPDEQFALGLRQKPETITRCFNCHATNVQRSAAGPVLDAMTPGVQCERCHGPGERHVALANVGKPSAQAILNTGRFNARNLVLTCAECHRSPDASVTSTAPELDDLATIRFQPVGFMASKCFQKSATFSCVTCHDPHQSALPSGDAKYSNACRSCHGVAKSTPGHRRTVRSPTCRRFSEPGANCVTCHMKKDSPLPMLTFTDHRIRIYPQ